MGESSKDLDQGPPDDTSEGLSINPFALPDIIKGRGESDIANDVIEIVAGLKSRAAQGEIPSKSALNPTQVVEKLTNLGLKMYSQRPIYRKTVNPDHPDADIYEKDETLGLANLEYATKHDGVGTNAFKHEAMRVGSAYLELIRKGNIMVVRNQEKPDTNPQWTTLFAPEQAALQYWHS